jgi:acetyltransferase
VESISAARKFMAAARAAARNKPVIVVRSGRVPEGARAASSHTGALAGADDVYDAAFRRAGLLRVDTTQQLFDAAATLAHLAPLAGERLAIVSNGGGPAVMATDALIAAGGRPPHSHPLRQLMRHAGQLVARQSGRHHRDAPAERYVAATQAVLADPDVDAALLIHAPTAIVPAAVVAGAVVAGAVVAAMDSTSRPLLTCWMGGDGVRAAADCCTQAGLPVYRTPEDAVGAFLQVVNYQRNQRELLEIPAADEQREPDIATARQVIDGALASGRAMLTEAESKRLLAAYGIPVVETRVARMWRPLRRRRAIGHPVALKIRRTSVKSDVGGVALNARCCESRGWRMPCCRAAGNGHPRPTGWLHGAADAGGDEYHELIAGIAVDRTFGPVVLVRAAPPWK